MSVSCFIIYRGDFLQKDLSFGSKESATVVHLVKNKNKYFIRLGDGTRSLDYWDSNSPSIKSVPSTKHKNQQFRLDISTSPHIKIDIVIPSSSSSDLFHLYSSDNQLSIKKKTHQKYPFKLLFVSQLLKMYESDSDDESKFNDKESGDDESRSDNDDEDDDKSRSDDDDDKSKSEDDDDESRSDDDDDKSKSEDDDDESRSKSDDDDGDKSKSDDDEDSELMIVIAQYMEKQIRSKTLLQNILDIYTYDFLGNARGFVEKVFNNSKKMNAIQESMRLIVPHDIDTNDVKKHLIFRHPIHISGPRYESIDQTKMKKAILVNKHVNRTINYNMNYDWSLRYGILGFTPLKKTKHQKHKGAWILHTWGVNLESRQTTDAQYVFTDGTFNMKNYITILKIMFRIIEKGSQQVHRMTGKRVTLRIVGLGLGAWLKAAPSSKHPGIKQKYLGILSDIAERNASWLTIKFPNFPRGNTLEWISSESKSHWETVENNHDPFGDGKKLKNEVLMLVNAWDDRSFIGNGGSRDNTLDGWMVAGGSKNFSLGIHGKPLGRYFVNSSFLHNIFFQPSLIKDLSSRWVYC